MYKYYDALINRSGDALAGHFIRLFDAAGNLVPIYADESETPIVTESGVINAAKSDDNGMVRFFVPSGDYDLRLYDAADAFLSVERAVPMVKGVSEVTLAGPDGAAKIGVDGGGTVQSDLDAAAIAINARPTTAALSSPAGGGMVGDLNPAAGAVPRSQHDINRDFLHAKTFGVAANDGVTDETAQMKAAIASAILQKKPLHFDGDVVVSDSLLNGALINSLRLVGSGENASRLINKCIGKPCLNIGNSYYTGLTDFSIVGNGLTGIAGNGHGIDMRDPNFGTGTFLPGFTAISRVSVSGHRGVGKAYDGTDIEAWGVYMANALQSTLHKVYTENNTGGIYAYQCFEPTFDTCVFNSNRKGGLIIDGCEAAFVYNPNCVGANDQDTGGTIHLANGGKSVGGFDGRAGAVIDCYSSGTRIVGGKYKNHKYTGICLYSPAMTSVVAPWVRQDEDDGVTGIYNALGAHISNPILTYAGAGVAINRFGIVLAPQQGYRDFGTVDGARFDFNGNGKFGHGIYIDGSLSSYMQGRLTGCRAGDARGASGPSTFDAFIRFKGQARGVVIRDNHVAAGNNMTVAVAYKLDEATAVTEQGLIFDSNTTDDFGGAGVITAVKTGVPTITGLQRDGLFEAPNGFKVANQQVVGARQAAIPDATGGATVDAEARATLNALLAAVRVHGLIAP